MELIAHLIYRTIIKSKKYIKTSFDEGGDLLLNYLTERRWYRAYTKEMKADLVIPEISIYTLFNETATKYGERAAIIYEDQTTTYSELKSKVDRLATAWNNLGMKKGKKIGIMLNNHPDYLICYYAAQLLGLTVIQINPNYTHREFLQLASDSEVNYLVIEQDSPLDPRQLIEEIVFLEQIFISGIEPLGEFRTLSQFIEGTEPTVKEAPISVREDIAVIQYTGGSTGKIKGAMLSHYNLIGNVIQSYMTYGKRMKFGDEMVLTAIPLYHVYGMASAMNLGVYIGATILLFPKFDVDDVLEKVKKYQPTFFPAIPQMYNAFINYPNVESYGLECLKFCSSGSGPNPVEVIKRFEALTGATISEGYGLSETSPSTHRNPSDGIRKVGSIGVPLPGTDCLIVDEDSNELPPKSVGELIIKGPQIMNGYWKKTEETKRTVRNGWIYTEDLAIMDEDGYFFIVGRKKEMVTVGGFNIYPLEIEGILYEHPDIEEAAVIGIPDPQFGEIAKAFIVAKKGRQLDVEDVKGHCYRKLTHNKVPKLFEIRERLPRNSVGKLLKKTLVDKENNRIKGSELRW